MAQTRPAADPVPQSVTQVHGLSRLFPFDRIIAYDIRDDVARTFRERIGFLDVRVDRVRRESLMELLAESDILCTCTSAATGPSGTSGRRSTSRTAR